MVITTLLKTLIPKRIGYCRATIADSEILVRQVAPPIRFTTFLGRDTAFLYGAEKFARQYDYPVIYYSVDKTRRGRYTVTFSLLSEHPASEPQYSIVERYARRLEDDIRRRPELWLWSHRRWKLTRNGRIRKDGTIKIIEK